MPRYHFHVLDGTALIDDQGTELTNINEAKAEAVKLAGELLRQFHPNKIWTLGTWKLVVNDGLSPQSRPPFFTIEIHASDGGSA